MCLAFPRGNGHETITVRCSSACGVRDDHVGGSHVHWLYARRELKKILSWCAAVQSVYVSMKLNRNKF